MNACTAIYCACVQNLRRECHIIDDLYQLRGEDESMHVDAFAAGDSSDSALHRGKEEERPGLQRR